MKEMKGKEGKMEFKRKKKWKQQDEKKEKSK